MRTYVDAAALQEYTTKLVAKLKQLFPGTPLSAATVADMTDTSRIYVYTGSETGYTAGNWYYWDGTAWVSGGVYNSTALVTDTTLTESGKAADAETVGDIFTPYTATSMTAPANITAGEYVLAAGTLYRATANIASGATLTPNGNVVAVTIGGELTSIATTLANKADSNGSYDTLTAGNAKQLLSTVGIEDKVPYNFRTSGGSADIGDRETDTVIGGTVAWRQAIENSNFSSGAYPSTATKSYDSDTDTMSYSATIGSGGYGYLSKSVTVAANHVYYVAFHVVTTGAQWIWCKAASSGNTSVSRSAPTTPEGKKCSYIAKTANSTSASALVGFSAPNGTAVTAQVSQFMMINLTVMFGETIANYLLELDASQYLGGKFIDSLFPKAYYQYNSARTLESVKVSAHKTVGFNAYNNADGTAKLVGGMQYQITGTYTALAYEDVSGNAETITPDADGYFTPTANGTLTVTGGNATNTCVHLVWDGEKDGTYEPYVENVYPLDDSLTLYGIPKLDADNRLYYDGDVYESDGTVTRKCGVLTGQTGAIGDTITLTGCDPNATDVITTVGHLAQVGTLSGTTLTLTRAISNVMIVYPLETPTTETAAPYQNPQVVDDFGTEEYVDYAVAAGTRDVAIPVGHTTEYMANLRAKLEMAPDSPDGDGDYIMRQTGGGNAFVPLVIPDELPDAPGTDGTYTLKITVADGTPTLAWVADT